MHYTFSNTIMAVQDRATAMSHKSQTQDMDMDEHPSSLQPSSSSDVCYDSIYARPSEFSSVQTETMSYNNTNHANMYEASPAKMRGTNHEAMSASPPVEDECYVKVSSEQQHSFSRQVCISLSIVRLCFIFTLLKCL